MSELFRDDSLPESVGVKLVIHCGEYGLHSHAQRGNEVFGGFCDSLEGGDPLPAVDPRLREDDDWE